MRGALAPLALVASGPAAAQSADVAALVARFEAARVAYDPAALAATLAPGYTEISPIGDVDTADEVLAFYAPDKRAAVPPMTDDEVTRRTLGGTAIVTLRKSLALPGGAVRRIRVRYVAVRAGAGWRMASAQYTPIPSGR